MTFWTNPKNLERGSGSKKLTHGLLFIQYTLQQSTDQPFVQNVLDLYHLLTDIIAEALRYGMRYCGITADPRL